MRSDNDYKEGQKLALLVGGHLIEAEIESIMPSSRKGVTYRMKSGGEYFDLTRNELEAAENRAKAPDI